MVRKMSRLAEMPVENKLKVLYQLQSALTQIDEKRAIRGELPLEVQDLEDVIEGLNTRIEKFTNEISEFEDAVAGKRQEVLKAAANIERYKKQLNDVKNNREYDTLSKEIESQELEIELCNKKIREGEARIAQKKDELEKAEDDLQERETDLELKRAELDEIMDETRTEEELLRDRAYDLETRIEPRLLLSFKRIRKNTRNGLAVVPIQRDACGGCFAQIPPQRQLDIKMHKKIIVCEYCGRILVDPELAGIKPKVVVVEEKPKRKRASRKKAEETE